MMKSALKLFSVLLVVSASAVAADFVAPKLTGPLVDEVGVMGASEAAPVERLLRHLNETSRAEFTVLITSSLQGLTIEDYGIKLAEAWKTGTKKDDKGLILIVAPSERRMRFEVGYGLEGDLPDVVTRRILDDVMRPYFKEGNMKLGIISGVFEVAKLLGMSADEIRAQVGKMNDERPSRRSGKNKNPLFSLVIGALFLGLRFGIPLLVAGIGGFIGFQILGMFGGLVGGIGGLILGFLLGGRIGHRGRSTWFGGGGGGGGFGGFSGGGGGSWGGGGGGFGGGGSSSSW